MLRRGQARPPVIKIKIVIEGVGGGGKWSKNES